MKAYRVWNVNEGWQELVFARHHNTAKWEVAAEYGSDFECREDCYGVLRAARLPHMDGYGDPFFKRGYIDRNKHLCRLSGIFLASDVVAKRRRQSVLR